MTEDDDRNRNSGEEQTVFALGAHLLGKPVWSCPEDLISQLWL